MDQVLLLLESKELAAALRDDLCGSYRVTLCDSSDAALDLLRELRPDVLVIDLELRGRGGLLLLKDAGTLRPPIILALTTLISPYVGQSALELKVGCVLLKPCPVWAIRRHIDEMLRLRDVPAGEDPQAIVRFHLNRLNFDPNPVGFRQLYIAVHLYAQNPGQTFKYELYPAVAALSGADNGDQIERNVRNLIKKAWKGREEAVWEAYFPNQTKCPTNKEFIPRLAEVLMEQSFPAPPLE